MSLLSSQAPSREYATRPDDERFPSVAALVDNAQHQRDLSKEIEYNVKDLAFLANEHNDIRMQSPRGIAKLTHWAFGQACRILEAPAAFLRDKVDAVRAADVLNYRIAQSPVGTRANLLAQAPNGTPEPTIRACTSDSYGRCWDAELYSAVQKQLTDQDPAWQLPPTWTGESAGAYRGDRDSFLVLVNGGSIVTDPTLRGGGIAPSFAALPNTNSSNPGGGPVDGMFRGILIRNSEVGASSVVIEQILFRYICGNHMLWGAVIDQSFRRRHVGFRRRHVGSHVTRDVVREISRIAYAWARQSPGRDEAIIKGLIEHEIAHTKEAVIDELRKAGATKEQAEDSYKLCEMKEAVSPRSFWGAAQGLTRLSQAETHQDDRYLLDQLAAKLLVKGRKLVAA